MFGITLAIFSITITLTGIVLALMAIEKAIRGIPGWKDPDEKKKNKK